MTVIVTDTGFGPDDWTGPIHPLEDARDRRGARCAPDTDPALLAGRLDRACA